MFPMTPAAASIPSQLQQEPTPIAKATSQGGKAKKKDLKNKASQAPPTPKAPKSCTLCEVVGHATNSCPELPQLKSLVHEAFHELNILKFHVDILVPPKILKMLRTNHPCALCDIHGHYSNYFPHLDEFHDFHEVIREYEATRSRGTNPLPVDLSTTSQPE